MLRPAAPADTDALVAMAARTGVFQPHEVDTLRGVLDDYHAVNQADGHAAHVLDRDNTPIGFVYLAPVAMTDRTWELWWIVVDPTLHGQGVGRRLLGFAEQEVRRAGGRLLLIETSSTPHYHPTREFYRRCGYLEVASVPDFYADGDGKVIFHRRLTTPFA